jgi:hypothetical protein
MIRGLCVDTVVLFMISLIIYSFDVSQTESDAHPSETRI